jgi:hypothetical protein
MKINKQTGLQVFDSFCSYLDEQTFAICHQKIKQIREVNVVWFEDDGVSEKDLKDLFNLQIDSILVEDDLEIAKQIVKKYAEYNLKLVTQPSSGVGRFCTIFCCKSKILKEVFEKITKEREAFQKFLKEDGDVKNADFCWLIANYFDFTKNTEENSACTRIIFQNNFCALFFTVDPFEFDSQKEAILNLSEKPSKYIYCEELLHDKISFYEFYWVVKELILKHDSLEDFAFVFSNNSKEKEFYQKFAKQLKHSN